MSLPKQHYETGKLALCKAMQLGVNAAILLSL